MINKNKGQVALEFLLTYGWAILAAIIVIGVLASFGVFNPKPQFTIYEEECWNETFHSHCSRVEVNKLEFGENFYPVNCVICYGYLTKEQIDEEWLDENCECLEGEQRCSKEYAECLGKPKDYLLCKKFKCGSYFVEVN